MPYCFEAFFPLANDNFVQLILDWDAPYGDDFEKILRRIDLLWESRYWFNISSLIL